jgi:hypothetical protein
VDQRDGANDRDLDDIPHSPVHRFPVELVTPSSPQLANSAGTRHKYIAVRHGSYFSCNFPILSEGDASRLLLDKRRPERRPAQTPEGFVEEHQLISNMQLDVARCRAVFMAQLGRPLNGWKSLAPHEKTLFAIFGLQFFPTIARQQKR